MLGRRTAPAHERVGRPGRPPRGKQLQCTAGVTATGQELAAEAAPQRGPARRSQRWKRALGAPPPRRSRQDAPARTLGARLRLPAGIARFCSACASRGYGRGRRSRWDHDAPARGTRSAPIRGLARRTSALTAWVGPVRRLARRGDRAADQQGAATFATVARSWRRTLEAAHPGSVVTTCRHERGECAASGLPSGPARKNSASVAAPAGGDRVGRVLRARARLGEEQRGTATTAETTEPPRALPRRAQELGAEVECRARQNARSGARFALSDGAARAAHAAQPRLKASRTVGGACWGERGAALAGRSAGPTRP
jgi:hypothetical protein